MGKEKIKIKKIPKKASLIPKSLKNIRKNESSLINNIKIGTIFNKKLKNKKSIFLDESEKEKNNCKIKKIKKKINKISKKSNNELINDRAICAHLLLNSYANVNPLEYMPDKTIEERMKSMREKVFSIFPELDSSKPNERTMDNEQQKKKEISSVNESHSTRELDII